MPDDFDEMFSKKYLMYWLYIGGIALVLISGFIWWTKVYESPYNVYWGMLETSMKTEAVTKHINEQANSTNLDQYIELNFGVDNLAYARTSLKDPNGKVVTESIGTLQNDYVRYTNIQTSKNIKQQNFSKILGKWAKATATNTSDSSVAAPFFTQTVIGIEGGNLVPIANLSPESRKVLLDQLHSNVIFDTSFNAIKRQRANGRLVYIYSVNIEPVAYVAFEKAFARDMGIKALDGVDPNVYHGKPAANVQFSVDAWSHHLVGIIYPGTSHNETYSGYGIKTNVLLPKATVSNQVLQALLGGAQ